MPIFDAQAYLGDVPFSSAMATRDAVLNTMRQTEITGVALISALAADCDFVTGNRRLREVVSPEDGLFGWVTLNAGYPAESQEEQRRHEMRRGIIGAALFGHDGQPVTLEDAPRHPERPAAIHQTRRDPCPRRRSGPRRARDRGGIPGDEVCLSRHGRRRLALRRRRRQAAFERVPGDLRQPGFGQSRADSLHADPAQAPLRQRDALRQPLSDTRIGGKATRP